MQHAAMHDDAAAMREALAEAELALVTGDVPVGAVVVGPGGDVAGRLAPVSPAPGSVGGAWTTARSW